MTKEDSLQVAVMDYIRYQYPYILAFHVPNGGSRNPIEGSKLKRMGTLAGVSDIILILPNKILCIELKIKPNKQHETQISFQKKVEQIGHLYYVCYDSDAAKKIIDDTIFKCGNYIPDNTNFNKKNGNEKT